MRNFTFISALIFSVFISSSLLGQNYFSAYEPSKTEVQAQIIRTQASKYYTVNWTQLKESLKNAPYREDMDMAQSTFVLNLPDLQGGWSTFKVLRNKTLHPDLNAKYPDILTFDGVNIDNPSVTAKFDITPQGFHAMIYNPDASTLFFDPIFHVGHPTKVIAYYKKDYIASNTFQCDVAE